MKLLWWVAIVYLGIAGYSAISKIMQKQMPSLNPLGLLLTSTAAWFVFTRKP